MMKISVWHGDMSDDYLKTVTQLGADAIDFGRGNWFPGVKEQGYPDLDELLKIKKKIQSYGLEINRVTLPDMTDVFMKNEEGAEVELENTCAAFKVFAEAKVNMVRQRFAGDTFPERLMRSNQPHRGGYMSRSESAWLAKDLPSPPDQEDLNAWWDRFCLVYDRLVPLADEHDLKIALHPSDTPLPDTPFGGIGFHRVIDAYPSRRVGYLYCCGTRSEAGGLPLVLDEVHNYGRKGRIFMIHLRNTRGSLATAGGFEEVLLDDGDMNMYKIIQELNRVGFDGFINADHIPAIHGDTNSSHQGLSYSIGYIKALLAALAVVG